MGHLSSWTVEMWTPQCQGQMFQPLHLHCLSCRWRRGALSGISGDEEGSQQPRESYVLVGKWAAWPRESRAVPQARAGSSGHMGWASVLWGHRSGEAGSWLLHLVAPWLRARFHPTLSLHTRKWGRLPWRMALRIKWAKTYNKESRNTA